MRFKAWPGWGLQGEGLGGAGQGKRKGWAGYRKRREEGREGSGLSELGNVFCSELCYIVPPSKPWQYKLYEIKERNM